MNSQLNWIDILLITAVVLYVCALLFIFIYSLSQAQLLWRYLHRRKPSELYLRDEQLKPYVTIQLPIYNERYVVERLIDAVCGIRYHQDYFEVQILDDSNDDTTQIISEKVKQWQSKGILIQHVRRADRSGFKAGALKHGLTLAKGELIAVFDADFVPEPDFLEQTVPYFTDPKMGMVQTRWGHINRDYSLLTALQAYALDAHFTIEQIGRNMGGFINFNGTAGVWRKSTILDAGDWESDTLTEDLDLSYRAQMKNWKFIYLEDVISPAELPPVMSALKSQQYRWTKGGAEVARKHFGNVMRSSFSFNKRWHGIMHLLNSVIFLCIIVSAIMSIPLLFAKHRMTIINDLFLWATFFLLSFVIIGAVYYVSSRAWFKKRNKSLFSFIITFPLFLSVSMGLSLHNAVAVVEGLLGRKTPFIRTPKFNIQFNSDNWIDNAYIRQSLSPMILAEGFLSVYFMYGIVTGIRLHDYGLLPFHFMLAFGFGIVFYFSVFQRKSQD